MTTKRSADSTKLCLFSYSDGRRCRMLRSALHPSLCHYHARIEQQYLEARQLGEELSATLTGHFHTAADINHVLGKVFAALAQRRISRRIAATLIWACQVMLQSLPELKAETKFRYAYDTWSRLIDRARPISPPPGSFNSAPPSATPPPSQDSCGNTKPSCSLSSDRPRPASPPAASPRPEHRPIPRNAAEQEPELASTS